MGVDCDARSPRGYETPADALRDRATRMGRTGVEQRSEQPQIRRETRTAAGKKVKESASEKSQKLLLGFMADEPQLFSQLSAWISESDFTHPFYRELATKLFAALRQGKADIATLLNDYVEDLDKEKQAAAIFHTNQFAEQLSAQERDRAIIDCIRSIKKDAADQRLRQSTSAEELQAAMREKAELQRLKLSIRR